MLTPTGKIHNIGLGQRWGNSSSARGTVQGVGDLVQLVGEQVPVEIQRHGGALVAEHLLHHLHVGAGGDGQGGRGVAQLVRVQPVQADRLGRPVQHVPAEHSRPQRRTSR